jgi:outer membrane beta-barrel protein
VRAGRTRNASLLSWRGGLTVSMLPSFVPSPLPRRVPAALVLALLLLPATAWAQGRVARTDGDDDPPEAGETAYPAEPEAPSSTRIACLDDTSDEGFARKGVQKRDFLKRHRFELAAVGGFHASDLLSSTYTFGGTLSFFPSEDFGLETLVTYQPVRFRIEDPFTAFDQRRRFAKGSALQAMGALLFSPVHAKFKFTEATILHGDLFLAAGAGRTFHDTVQGLSWQAGGGFRIYLAKHAAFRLDVRDFILPQEVLGRGRITHNLTIFGGFGLWLG